MPSTPHAPRQRVFKPKTEPKKAKSEADWIAQEKAEGQAPRPNTGDLINDVVGRSMYMAQASYPTWISPTLKRRLTVTRFYFHPPALIIDKPGTVDEMHDKARFFTGTDIAYVGITPGSAIEPEELAAMIDKAIQRKKVAPDAAQAPKKATPTTLPKAVAPKKSTPPKAKKAKGR